MGELFWNKIFGAVLGTALVLFSLVTLSDIFFNPLASASHGGDHHGEEAKTAKSKSPFPGYPIVLPDASEVAVVIEEGPVDYGVLLAAADAGAGQRVFEANCQSCHNVGPDAANSQGPRMWDVVGRSVAHQPDYGYSAALGGWGEDWTYEHLDGFIERPSRYLSGTAMNFRGIGDEATRMNVIAYLRTLTDEEPYPLPEPLPEVVDEVDVDVEVVGDDEALDDLGEQIEAAVEEVVTDAVEPADGAEAAPQAGVEQDAVETPSGDAAAISPER